MRRNDHLPIVLVFLGFVFGVTLLNVLTPPQEVSTLERRDLAQFPQITLERLLDGAVARDYATYLQDQAAFRDEIRFTKSFVERMVFRKAENNGVYVIGPRVYDKFYGIRGGLIDTAARRMNEIIAAVEPSAVYVSVIPTKAHALDGGRYLLSDQREIAGTVERIVEADYVDLIPLAAGDDEPSLYYGADPHLNTEGAIRAYEILARAMALDPVLDYELEVATDEYIGSEYGKAASWAVPKDVITLARNPLLDGMTLCRFRTVDEDDCYDSIYVEPTPEMVDLYDIWLGGLSPLMTITNEQAPADDRLVIFKDSYAHAVAPFLAQHFREVTLVDLRYVRRDYVLENVDLDGATLLFLYSTSVLNTDPQIVN
jgi:hypothetical protein